MRAAACLRLSGRYDVELLLEVLVRGAVLAARQRHALARGTPARAGVAADRAAIERHTLAELAVHVLRCQLHVLLAHAKDPQLVCHREVVAHVLEERADWLREVVPVERQALHRRLARPQKPLARYPDVLPPAGNDIPRQLAVERATELIHRASLTLVQWACLASCVRRLTPRPLEPSTNQMLSSR